MLIVLLAALAVKAFPTLEALVLGAVTNFFDTLGIGPFAPTMAWFKFRDLVADRLIPSTMLVGHTFPAMIQANIFWVMYAALVMLRAAAVEHGAERARLAASAA